MFFDATFQAEALFIGIEFRRAAFDRAEFSGDWCFLRCPSVVRFLCRYDVRPRSTAGDGAPIVHSGQVGRAARRPARGACRQPNNVSQLGMPPPGKLFMSFWSMNPAVSGPPVSTTKDTVSQNLVRSLST